MTFMIKNNNLSFEDLDIYYRSYWTHCYASDNICPDLHICWYSIYENGSKFFFILIENKKLNHSD